MADIFDLLSNGQLVEKREIVDEVDIEEVSDDMYI